MNKRSLFLIVLSAAINANAIEIEFAGNKPDIAGQIENRLKSETNPTFSLLDSLTNALSNRAYLDASITVKNGRLVVTAGPKYILSLIRVKESSVVEIPQNRPFDSANVAFAIKQQLQNYRDSGYHYVSAQTENVILKDSLVTLEMSLNLGPKVKYGEPLFTGLSRTDRELVKKYLPENESGTLTTEFITRSEQAAAEIPFVKFSPPVSVQPRPGYTVSDIAFKFLEKTPVRIDGAAGLAGKNEGAVWSLAVTLNNLFGRGKQVNIASQRRDSRRNTLDIGYQQPVFLAGLGELSLNVNTRDYRDNFYEFGVFGGLKSRINRTFATALNFGWKSVKPVSGNTGYNRFTGQFLVSHSSFNSSFNPDRGLSIGWGIDFSFRNYTAQILPATISSRTFNETRNKLSVSLYQPITGPVLTRLSLNYDGLETKESLPPLSELVLIGGPGSLRGYRNEQFAALRAAYGTFEPRIRFEQGFIFAFYDAAYLNNRIQDVNNSIITEESFRWSYGLGFGLGNSQRSLIMSLGINPDLGLNDPLLSIDLSSDI